MNKRYCRYCQREIVNAVCNQQYHIECRKLHQKSVNKAYHKNKYYKNRCLLLELKVNGCAICGYNKCPTALEFHHISPKDKSFYLNVNDIMSKSYKDIINEVNKCVLLCSNCHRELHYYQNVKMTECKTNCKSLYTN